MKVVSSVDAGGTTCSESRKMHVLIAVEPQFKELRGHFHNSYRLQAELKGTCNSNFLLTVSTVFLSISPVFGVTFFYLSFTSLDVILNQGKYNDGKASK